MKLKKLILFILFFTLSAANVQLAVANSAGDVAQAVKASLGQRMFDRTVGVNPYWVYNALHASPMGPVLSTTVLLGSLIGLRSLYHAYYNKRAEKYEELMNGLGDDLAANSINNKRRMRQVAASLWSSPLRRQVEEFYNALESRIASRAITSSFTRRAGAAVHGTSTTTHTAAPTTTALKPEDILREIKLYTLGKGNFIF